MRKWAEIERLRGVAIVMACFNHAPLRVFVPGYCGVVGVHLFFAISGLVVMRSLLGALEKAPDVRSALNSFFLRRLFRIMPLALVVLGVTLAICICFQPMLAWSPLSSLFRQTASILGLYYNYVFIETGLDHVYFWSLNVEQHFYLGLPLVVLFVPSPRGRLLVLAATAIAALAYNLTREPAGTDFATWHEHFRTHARLDLLAAAAALGLTAGSWRQHLAQTLAGPERADLAWLARGWSVALLLVIVCIHRFFAENSAWGWLTVDLAALTLVVLASLDLKLVLELPVLGWVAEYLGARSYAIYLSHSVVWKMCNEVLLRHPLIRAHHGHGEIVFFYVLLVLATVEGLHRLVERPALEWANRRFAPAAAPAEAPKLAAA